MPKFSRDQDSSGLAVKWLNELIQDKWINKVLTETSIGNRKGSNWAFLTASQLKTFTGTGSFKQFSTAGEPSSRNQFIFHELRTEGDFFPFFFLLRLTSRATILKSDIGLVITFDTTAPTAISDPEYKSVASREVLHDSTLDSTP